MKKILIVGATSAIASACARLWANQGAEMFLVGRSQVKMEQVAADLRARGAGDVTTYVMDAADFTAHSKMIESCLATLKQIDIGMIAHGSLPDQKTCELDVNIALEELSLNGTSVIALLTRLANQLETQRCGTLAIISSVAGDRGRPSNYLYGTAKAAVSTFCEGLRARLFKVGVHVITIKPGFVDTPMTKNLSLPSHLVASPEQVSIRIVKGIERNVDTIYTPGFWSFIMLIIRLIPSFIFKRLSL
ncbi:short-chain dehydrogenase of unknown substrate specificity [Pseudomonas sp. GM50]|uniref:SDR family oxidoreductase n=1 Tax=Pseudomonas sp. GM50 TaxID=1144332 RepID=UPI000270AFE6|nr:SDR family oxidoreductase [Pseudomonas sp. GM50]EJM70717.1 short-chain dehydrogenase of unknown substrate specificity [Pseudomonas sp. GM50]